MTGGETCRLCGSGRAGPRFRESGLSLLECADCRTLFRPRGEEPENPAAYYDEDYYLDTWPGSLGRFFHHFNPKQHHKTRFLERQLAEFEGVFGGPGRLLDVGCANGVLVFMAKERGWEAEGIEVSEFAASWGREQFGINIREGVIEDLAPEPAYHVITLFDTLEHVPEPQKMIRECYDRLLPGGVLAVLTPDTLSLVNHLVHAAQRLSPKRAQGLMKQLYHEDHLCFFNREALSRALIETGFLLSWMEGYDEDPRDTETRGLTKLGVYLARAAASVIHRQHEVLYWARKIQSHPEEKYGLTG